MGFKILGRREEVVSLQDLEAESIYLLRETAASFKNPILLYSGGKDSSVLLHLAEKAFAPLPIPFPALHVDTGFKFHELYEFRDRVVQEKKINLIIRRNEKAISQSMNPHQFGTEKCCMNLKTQALLEALRELNCDAAIGGARRDEEKSRSKEKYFSIRNDDGKWVPQQQRPEFWGAFNLFLRGQESIRVFPLSDWTELDIWNYIYAEDIPIPNLYFSKRRTMIKKDGLLLTPSHVGDFDKNDMSQVNCRFRTLGCTPCTGAIESSASTVKEIIHEITITESSERMSRVIDSASDFALERKKKQGYF